MYSKKNAACIDNLLGGLELHVFIDRKLGWSARSLAAAGSNYAKASGIDFDGVGIRRTLSGDINVVRRNQIVERYIFAFAGKVAALGLCDADKITLYACDIDGGLRRRGPGSSRRALHLLGIDVHTNSQYNHDAEKTEHAAH